MKDVKQFGVKGDGSTDDTQAIQRALDAAAETQGTVHLPAGVYLCSGLKLHSHVTLAGEPSWSWRENGGTILKLADGSAPYLVDVSDTYGARLEGVCLDGGKLEGATHAVWADPQVRPAHEHSLFVERCRISDFSGDGLHCRGMWVFVISHSMISHNQGHAVWISGCDGLVHDCWLSGNGGAGIAGYEGVGNTTITGNRVEWNRQGGIVLNGASHYNITGNYMDRCGGPGIALLPSLDGSQPTVIASVTGNLVNRCGAKSWGELDEAEQSQMLFRDVRGLACVGNTMAVARGDRTEGDWSPEYGIVYERLADSVIKDNVLHFGALRRLMLDLGGHGENVLVKDNVGSLFRPGIDVLRTWI